MTEMIAATFGARWSVAFSISLVLVPLGSEAQEMGVEDYNPRSTLVVSGEPVTGRSSRSSTCTVINAAGNRQKRWPGWSERWTASTWRSW